MFIYKISSIDKLLTVVKNREYVENNPELCKLLENPLIKDDTELAIRYNEYKLNYPNAGKDFVDYFYTHGPELDTGSLIEWRKKIQNDPELYEYASYNDTQIETIWNNKQSDTSSGYSWVGDLFDCLSKPCQYLGLISPSIGSLADTQAKYSSKNTNGSDSTITLLGIPTYMVNKIPQYLTQGVLQLTDMISQQSQDVLNVIERNGKAVKEDPYIIKRAELIGGDLLADIASRMGDCFRIYEYQRRFNPYNYEQNQEKADRFGTVVYDENGNPKTVTPNGNNADLNGKTTIYSDNRRLSPNVTSQNIISSSIGNVDSSNAMPMKITAYNAVLTSDNNYYIDPTSYDPRHPDPWGDRGYTAGTSIHGAYIMPSTVSGAKELSKKNVEIRNGGASKVSCVLQYFRALLQTKYPTLELPQNFKSLIIKAYKSANLNVTLFFPNGQRTLPIFDCGGGASSAQQGIPWVDITAQYFLTSEGMNLGTLYGSEGAIKSPSPMPTTVNSAQLNSINVQTNKIKALTINGAQNNIVNGLFFFSASFCTTNGLDPAIYGQPGSAKIVGA